MSAESKDEQDQVSWWARNTQAPVYPKDKVRKYDAGTIIISLTVTLLLLGVILWTILGKDPARPTPGQFQSIEHPASVEAVLSQCGDIFTFDPPQHYYGAFDTEEVMSKIDTSATVEIPFHPMIIPVYGYMSGDGDIFEKSMYTIQDSPKRSELIRAMWDGAIIIWYSPGISSQDRAALSIYAKTYPNVVAVEWAWGELPLDRNYAFSTWNVSQSCKSWDEEVFEQFVEFVNAHPEYRPETEEPPNATLTEDNLLYPISPPR